MLDIMLSLHLAVDGTVLLELVATVNMCKAKLF